MRKIELVRNISANIEGVTQKQVVAVLDVLAEVVADAMKKDDKVTLPNLGTFSVKDVPERRGKIMLGDRKGEEYVAEAHKEPKFKLLKNFKKMLA